MRPGALTLRHRFGWLFLLGLGLGLAAPSLRAQDPASAPSTPEAAVRSFATDFSKVDLTSAARYVDTVPNPEALAKWATRLTGTPANRYTIRIKEATIEGEVNPMLTRVRVKGTAQEGEGEAEDFEEVIPVKKVGDAWKLIPITPAEIQERDKRGMETPLLQSMATLVAHPVFFLNATDQSERYVTCLSQMKRLTTALIVLAGDHDDRFALRADSMRAALRPYLRKGEEPFHCPGHEEEGAPSYTLNPQIAGKPMSALESPGTTVAIYEGRKGVLDFRHDGRAVVGFADGHVRGFTRDEAKKLRWKP